MSLESASFSYIDIVASLVPIDRNKVRLINKWSIKKEQKDLLRRPFRQNESIVTVQILQETFLWNFKILQNIIIKSGGAQHTFHENNSQFRILIRSNETFSFTTKEKLCKNIERFIRNQIWRKITRKNKNRFPCSAVNDCHINYGKG